MYQVVEVDLRKPLRKPATTVIGRYADLTEARQVRDSKPRAKGDPIVRAVEIEVE